MRVLGWLFERSQTEPVGSAHGRDPLMGAVQR